MQLIRATALVVALLLPTAAMADGELSMRGVYYKERATRVIQPMLDGRFDVGDEGILDTHVLIDAITSASVAAGGGGEAFDEQRYELGAGYVHQLEDLRVGGQARASYEPDYTSLFAGFRGELELADKNVVLGAGLSYGHDWVSNAGIPDGPNVERIEEELDTFLGSVSLSQILSPNTVVALTYDVSYLVGFQSNPYRRANADGAPLEKHPEHRTRHAVATSVRHFVARTETTAIASYRLYRDTWELSAHTPELRVVQQVTESMDLGAGYRFHWQSRADFYRDSYAGTMSTLVSDDEKLSSFTSHTVIVRGSLLLSALGIPGALGAARGELVLEYVDQNNRFGNAGVAHVGLTVPFEY